MDETGLTDEQLAVAAAREGSDGPAFVELLSRYREPVWRMCFRLMGDHDDAHDAAQEVFLRLFGKRGSFEGRSKYSTWVHGVALRTCLSLRRSRSRRRTRVQTVDNEVLQHEPSKREAPAVAEGSSFDLQRMLESLDEEDRAMMILKYAEGHSYTQLSEMFGLAVSSCKMRLSRIRDRLRARFPDQTE